MLVSFQQEAFKPPILYQCFHPFERLEFGRDLDVGSDEQLLYFDVLGNVRATFPQSCLVVGPFTLNLIKASTAVVRLPFLVDFH